jgi:hypothetical protein
LNLIASVNTVGVFERDVGNVAGAARMSRGHDLNESQR